MALVRKAAVQQSLPLKEKVRCDRPRGGSATQEARRSPNNSKRRSVLPRPPDSWLLELPKHVSREELKRASDQIAAGAEEASSAAQESLAAFNKWSSITRNCRMQS